MLVGGWRIAYAQSVQADFNGDGCSDLAVGAPFKDVGDVANTGTVHVLYGTSTGLTAAGSQFWHQNSPGITDTAKLFDDFGRTLALLSVITAVFPDPATDASALHPVAPGRR